MRKDDRPEIRRWWRALLDVYANRATAAISIAWGLLFGALDVLDIVGPQDAVAPIRGAIQIPLERWQYFALAGAGLIAVVTIVGAVLAMQRRDRQWMRLLVELSPRPSTLDVFRSACTQLVDFAESALRGSEPPTLDFALKWHQDVCLFLKARVLMSHYVEAGPFKFNCHPMGEECQRWARTREVSPEVYSLRTGSAWLAEFASAAHEGMLVPKPGPTENWKSPFLASGT